MVACLTVYSRHHPTVRWYLDTDSEYLLGRSPDCSLKLDDPSLSRTHARLVREGEQWQLEDLDSKNGVRIDGERVQRARLQDGAWVSLGDLLARFEMVSDEVRAADENRRKVQWDTSVELSRELVPELGLELLLQRLLASVLQAAGAERGFVKLANAAGELSLRVRAPPGDSPFSGSRSAVARAVDTGRPVVTCDAGADVLLGNQPSVAIGGIRALACLPLRIETQLIGVIYVDSRTPGKRFTELDLEILTALADHAALVVGVTQVRKDLASLAQRLPPQLTPGSRPDRDLVRVLAQNVPSVPVPESSVGYRPG